MLTEKQRRFCDEYLTDMNAAQAYVRAGYKPHRSRPSRLLKQRDVAAYIAERKQQIQNDLEITQERILKEYARIAFCDMRRFYDAEGRLLPIGELDDDTVAALSYVETTEKKERTGEVTVYTQKVKTYDKYKALEDLAKYLGLFKQDASAPAKEIDLQALTKEDLDSLLTLQHKLEDKNINPERA